MVISTGTPRVQIVHIIGKEVIFLDGEELSIDLSGLYRFLRCVYDGKNDISSIVKHGGFSRTTVTKYISICEALRMIKVKKHGKKKVIELTEKAMHYLILYERLLSLLKTS